MQLLPVYPTLHLLQFELHFGAILLSLRAGNRPRRRAQFSQDYSGEVCNYPLFATIFLCKYLFHFSKKMRTNKMKLQKEFKRCFNCCFQNNILTNSFSNIDLGFKKHPWRKTDLISNLIEVLAVLKKKCEM